MISVAAYCRVSTQEEDQLNSFRAQKAYFDRVIGAVPQWQLCRIYADAGISGTVRDRPAFRDMMEDARRGQFQILLTKEVSRFSRNLLDAVACTRELRALGIEVRFLTDGISTADPDSELRLSIMAALAQEESRKTSARVRWGQTRSMERGVVFGHSLLGYRLQSGVLLPEPKEAATVRLIFEKYALEGKSGAQIARELTREQIPPGPWSPGRILKILKNEKYAGDLIQKKSWTPDYLTHRKEANPRPETYITIPNHHPALVDRALWDAAQALRRKRTPGAGRKGLSCRSPFSGKIFCGICGSVCSPRVHTCRDGTPSRRWRCSRVLRKGHGPQGCPGRVSLPEAHVCALVQSALGDADTPVPSQAQVQALLGRALGPEAQAPLRSSTEAALLQLQEKEASMADALLTGVLTARELTLLREKYAEEKAELLGRLSRAEAAILPFPLLADLAGTVPESPDALALVTERITLLEGGRACVQLTGLSRPRYLSMGKAEPSVPISVSSPLSSG